MSLAEYVEKQRNTQGGDEAAIHTESDMPSVPAMASQSSDKSTEPGVLLRLHNRKLWVFPWAHFIEAEYFPQSNASTEGNFTEQIRIVFGARETILCGRNLATLMQSIVRHRIIELREVPEKFLDANHHDAEPGVVHMEIRTRAK